MAKRLANIKKRAADYGVDLVKPRRGSHWKFRRAKDGSYPVPAHNGLRTEIDDVYIRGLCNHFGIDPAEFAEKL